MRDAPSATAYLEAGVTPEIKRRHRRCVGLSLALYVTSAATFVLAELYGLPPLPVPPVPPPVVILIPLKLKPKKKNPERVSPRPKPVFDPRDVKVSEARVFDFHDEQGKLEAVLKKFNGWIGFGNHGRLDHRFRFGGQDWVDDPVPPGENTTDDYSSFDLGEAFALPRRVCSGAVCDEQKYALFPPDQMDRIDDALKKYAAAHGIPCVQKARLRYDDTAESGFTVEEPVVACQSDADLITKRHEQ